jgi:hypothetical protein
MKDDRYSSRYLKKSIYGFLAGFLATLTFHQIALWLLWGMKIAPFAPYNMAGTLPWGVPAVISLALWGGVWGVLFAFVQSRFPRHGGYWASAFFFGAIFPSLVALLVVLPMKGLPVGGGWHWPLLFTAFLINGVWGTGTGLLYRYLFHMPETAAHHGHPTQCTPGMSC